MNPVDFCFWLQGHFEMSGNNSMTNDQVRIMKEHLDLVFVHSIDPARNSETTATEEALNQAHTPAVENGFSSEPCLTAVVVNYDDPSFFDNDPLARC